MNLSSVDVDSSHLKSIAAATRIALASNDGHANADSTATSPHTRNKAFTFAVVRNPYDRAVSSWMYTASWWCSFPDFVELLAER